MYIVVHDNKAITVCFVCSSLTSLCHSNGYINPFTALTRIFDPSFSGVDYASDRSAIGSGQCNYGNLDINYSIINITNVCYNNVGKLICIIFPKLMKIS